MVYKKVTLKELDLLTQMQQEIFPESQFSKGFDAIYRDGPSVVDCIVGDFYIEYLDDEPCGIFGLYIPYGVENHKSIWLGWFGVLQSHRGKGIGKEILFDAMELAKTYSKDYGVKYFRLFTAERMNVSAQHLYNKEMTLKEYYRHDEIFCDYMIEYVKNLLPGLSDETIRKGLATAIAIFSKSLYEDEILVPWDNYYMGYIKMLKFESAK